LFFEVFGPFFDGGLSHATASIMAGIVAHEQVFASRQGYVAL
jgi:hypothetical protein